MSSNRRTSTRTQRRVLDAARGLFNEQGTAAVSTNHIAAAAEISPGNLYYHFKDKQAIIRGLFAQYSREFDGRWAPSADSGKNFAKFGQNLASGAMLAWEYRFLQRELLALLRADPELRASYEDVYRRRLSEMRAFAEQLVWQKMLRPPLPPRTLEDLVVAIWLIAEGWLPFLDLTGGDPHDRQQVSRMNDLVMVALEPYLTDEGRGLLEEWL
jgi:AcrR family transcriptional regulator